MKKISIKEQPDDLVLYQGKLSKNDNREYCVITHENTEIDESVRSIYRELVYRSIRAYLAGNQFKPVEPIFLQKLEDTIRHYGSDYVFWGYEIVGVAFFEVNSPKAGCSFGSIVLDGRKNLTKVSEKIVYQLVFSADSDKGKASSTDMGKTEKQGASAFALSIRDSLTGIFSWFKNKGNATVSYLLIALLALAVYWILTRIFHGLD